MSLAPRDWSRFLVFTGWVCLVAGGCGDSPANSGTAYRGHGNDRAASESGSSVPYASVPVSPTADSAEASETSAVGEGVENAASTTGTPVGETVVGDATASENADANATTGTKPNPEDPARPRTFVVEGPNDALRVGFDDLDLMKLINMEPVTSDCVEKMPRWLRDLGGKQVRIRGYMKPSGLSEGIPEFIFVRSTDLCCFGPKGKVYHLIAVKLKAGTTTDYIELKPFDVSGKFRIEKIELDDGLIFLLYHIDEAAIIRK